MTDFAMKRQLRYAKKIAKQKLVDLQHTVIDSDNKIVCFTATFGDYVERKIRVVVDDISDKDISLIKQLNILSGQTKEIWCKKKGQKDFVYLIFNKDNNIVPCFDPVNKQFPH